MQMSAPCVWTKRESAHATERRPPTQPKALTLLSAAPAGRWRCPASHASRFWCRICSRPPDRRRVHRWRAACLGGERGAAAAAAAAAAAPAAPAPAAAAAALSVCVECRSVCVRLLLEYDDGGCCYLHSKAGASVLVLRSGREQRRFLRSNSAGPWRLRVFCVHTTARHLFTSKQATQGPHTVSITSLTSCFVLNARKHTRSPAKVIRISG